MRAADVVIVGAGHGGAQAAIALRQQGFEGSIIMIGREPEWPYERPPLSKEYLAREKPFERIMLRPSGFWSEKHIHMLLNSTVTGIDPVRKVAKLADGEQVSYGKLVWSAGGSARRLNCPGADLAGIHTVRDKADVDGLMGELDQGVRRVVVIGGGYIGLEAAAVLTKLGCKVTLVEALDRVLARVAGQELSRFYEQEHRAQGVEVRLSATVESIVGETAVTGVRLAGGEVILCEIVVVGIGIVPSVDPLLEAGAKGNNGVEVDGSCQTDLPDVYAIGDCAAHINRFAGLSPIRLESVQNANDMATIAAKTICGLQAAYEATPWFWSNQYDLKLQTVGLSMGHDQTVVRGDPSVRSFAVIYLREGRVIALDCVNAVKDYVQGRKLVELGISAPPEVLSDTSIPLKDLASANA